MPERRVHPRKKMVLPVKVTLGDATLLTHTIDVTCTGARLGGLHTELQPGQTVVLHRGPKKARFRVIWVRHVTSKEIHVGLECLEPQNGFLGIDLSDQEREGDKSFETFMTLLSKSSKSAEPRQ